MIHIAMPMAGEGKRFAERGYTFPKPLVEIRSKPMVELVVQNLVPSEAHRFIFIALKEHIQRYALGDVLSLIAPGSALVPVTSSTAGALCSVLVAMEYLDNDEELLIANADQWVDASINDFLSGARRGAWDGYIMTFPASHPKWSYAKLVEGQVVAIAEKRPITSHATVGWYYFRRGHEFVAAAERMILKNATVEGEFYVAPVYNEFILMGKRVGTHPIAQDQMHSLGTPEDVDTFVSRGAETLNRGGR